MTDEPLTNYPHLRAAQRVVWTKHCTLSGHARSIAAYLLNRMNHNYEGAFPSVDRMADDMGWERKTIIKYTKEIVDSRLFERTAGRRGMYTYRVTDIDKIGEMLDAKLAEYVQAFWAGLNPKQLNGTPDGPVPGKDWSAPGTGTGTPEGPRPVRGRDTERLSIKGQVKGQVVSQYLAHPTGEPLPTQIASADNSLTSKSKSGAELQLQEPEVVDQGEGVSWVERSQIPPTYANGVWFDRSLGKLSLVNCEQGRAFYRSLRDEGYEPELIRKALTAAGVKAPSVRARSGGYEALVRTYVGYALERQTATQQAATARETAFQRPRPFQP